MLDEIADQFQHGPLSLLRQWYQVKQTVRVITRHDRGIRGVATGNLVAFDKHFNLVLRDVEESYTVLLHVQRPTQSGGVRSCRRQEKRHRKMKQVFVAGNSVVLVSAAPQGQGRMQIEGAGELSPSATKWYSAASLPGSTSVP